jgi:hypothetical protein
MLCICCDFAIDYHITFNPKKTLCIKFGDSINESDIAMLNGDIIKWVDKIKHLGNMVSYDLLDYKDCQSKCSTFIGNVNKLIANFGKLQPTILCKLFQSYCCSFYGSQLWCPDSRGFNRTCIVWNKAVRKLLNVHYSTHTWLLGPIIGRPHIRYQLYVRTLKYLHNALDSSNKLVNSITGSAMKDANSPMGAQFAFFRSRFSMTCKERLSDNINYIYNSPCTTSFQEATIKNVKTLLDLRTNCYEVHGFETMELDEILDHITTA